MPTQPKFWGSLFGANLIVRLGLFHLLHRIVDTLDSKCELHWKGLVSLKNSVCKHDPDDMAAPLTSLGDGTFGRDGKKHTAADVELLRHSKRWKERCDPFLKKVIQPEKVIKHEIERWIVDYKDQVDSQGRALFTRKTEKIAMEQTTKVTWVADPQNIEMCRKIPAGKRSSHQLPKWQSNRPESGLEKFHEHLAHLANTGSGKELADALTLGGTADYNVKARWREHVNKKKLLGQEIPGSVEYLDEPRFFDHSRLEGLNRRAIGLGLRPIFDFIVTPGKDTGEVFLSKYHEQQEKRNSSVSQDKGTKLCLCRHCRAYLPSEPAMPSIPEEFFENDAVERDQEPAPEPEQHCGQRIDQCKINSMIADARPPPAAPWFCPAPLSVDSSNCCFGWPPFYCKKKLDYYNRKYHGGGRKGRPPNCEFNCQGQK